MGRLEDELRRKRQSESLTSGVNTNSAQMAQEVKAQSDLMKAQKSFQSKIDFNNLDLSKSTAVNSGSISGPVSKGVVDKATTSTLRTASDDVVKKGFFDSKISKGMKGAGTAASMGMTALGIGGEGDHSDIGNTASGAMDGFNAGMMTGNPHIAVAGAVVGGLAGLSGAGAKRKEAKAKAKAAAEAKHQQKMVSIEAEKGQKIQGALTRMGAAFSKNLKGKEDKVNL